MANRNAKPTKPRYVQVTDSAEIEAIIRGLGGDLKMPIGGFNGRTWFAYVHSLREWREWQRSHQVNRP